MVRARATKADTSKPLESRSRQEVAILLYDALSYFFRKRGYSVQSEVGVLPWGRARADIVALNMKREMIIGEIKSCWQDFHTDSKWHQYIEKCDKFYFIFPADVWEKEKHRILPEIEKYPSTGVYVVDLDRWYSDESIGYRSAGIRCVRNAKVHKLSDEVRLYMLTKLAYKGGVLDLSAYRGKKHGRKHREQR